MHGKARQCTAKPGNARQSQAMHGKVRQCTAKPGNARKNCKNTRLGFWKIAVPLRRQCCKHAVPLWRQLGEFLRILVNICKTWGKCIPVVLWLIQEILSEFLQQIGEFQGVERSANSGKFCIIITKNRRNGRSGNARKSPAMHG